MTWEERGQKSGKTKGQLISKGLFGVFNFKSTKKINELFLWISALASRKRSNQKSKGTLLC